MSPLTLNSSGPSVKGNVYRQLIPNLKTLIKLCSRTAMAASRWSLPTAVRSEVNGTPPPIDRRPLINFTKPSWIVKSESNVYKERIKNPDPPCVICKGSGRVDCHQCRGKGRTNEVHLAMLPKGAWPKWCRTCGGSGLGYCSRCLGTGEFRHKMGFSFMKREEEHDENYSLPENRGNVEDLFS